MLPEGEGNRLGKFQAIAFVIGDIIGSGIFVSPSSILKHSGSVGLSLCIWAAGALIASIGALVYVELGTSIRKSGCDFAYLTHVRWYPLAAGFLWVSVTLTYPTILAIQTITLGEYVVAGIHQVRPLDLSWHPALARLIGFTFLWVLVYLNLFSLRKFSARLQVVVTTSKLLVISVIAITGFYYMIFKGRTEAFEHGFAKSETDPGEIVLALYASLFAYNGWDILNFGTEEIENPRSTLPIAALCGIAVSAGVYVAINAAYFSVLTIEEFKTSEAVAMDFAAKTLGDVKYLVPFLIALLLLGNLNSTIFGCSR